MAARGGEAGPSLGPASSNRPAPGISIGRLPVTSRDLFGRDAELTWLDDCWQNGVRVASIIAWGGVGKSALVNAWLRRMDEAGWRGAEKVFGWSFYSQGTDRLSSSDEFVDAALRWFGDKEPTAGSPWDKGERLAALVRQHRAILVLDGVEPLQTAPGIDGGRLQDPAMKALVKELGAQNKGLCVITSRLSLTDLEALSGSKVEEHALDHLSDEAGAELLKARGAKGLEEELRAAAGEYEGHSLALTLLGTYLRRAHKGDVRKRDLIPPLEGKPAHRMMAIYERWFDEKPELAILRMLGLFDRPAPEDEIAAVRAEPVIPGLTDALVGLPESAWNQAVTALRDVGLLAEGSEDDERLDAHPLVREYFGEQLRQQQPEAFREGHRRLFVYLQEKAKPLPETIEEMAPLQHAMIHGCHAGEYEAALNHLYKTRAHRDKKHFWMKKLGAFASVETVLSYFLAGDDSVTDKLPAADQALVLHHIGIARRAQGRLKDAENFMRRSLEQYRFLGDHAECSIVASAISEVLLVRGEVEAALDQARVGVTHADSSRHENRPLINRTTLAAALAAKGRTDDAAATFDEADRMHRARHPESPLLSALWGFRYCTLLLDQGRHTEVRVRASHTLARGRAWYPELDLALDQASLGRAYLVAAQRGDVHLSQCASVYLERAVDGLRRAGYQDHLSTGLLARAALHIHTRAFDLARKDLAEALTIATRCGFRLHECDAHLGLARLAFAEEKPDEARPHVDRARDLITATGYHRRDGELEELTRKVEASAPPA